MFFSLSVFFYITGELEGGTGPAQGGCWYQWKGRSDRERKQDGEYGAKNA
jgi:hypothetical protein